MRNVFGRGEKFQTNLGTGTKANSTFQVMFSKPLLGSWDRSVNFLVHQLHQNYLIQRSYEEILRGISLSYMMNQNHSSHQWSYQTEWREIGNLPEQASMHIRQEVGHTLKSSVKYIFTHNRLDDLVLPSRGYRYKLATVS